MKILSLPYVFVIPFAVFTIYMAWATYILYYTPLNDCAREHNVYACEYVAQPKVSSLLPPPTNEKE